MQVLSEEFDYNLEYILDVIIIVNLKIITYLKINDSWKRNFEKQ